MSNDNEAWSLKFEKELARLNGAFLEEIDWQVAAFLKAEGLNPEMAAKTYMEIKKI